jgi:hypothetical protein
VKGQGRISFESFGQAYSKNSFTKKFFGLVKSHILWSKESRVDEAEILCCSVLEEVGNSSLVELDVVEVLLEVDADLSASFLQRFLRTSRRKLVQISGMTSGLKA